MNSERDKFLTELIGLCYHDYEKLVETDSYDEPSSCECMDFKCSKCGDYQEKVLYRDFSGWAVKQDNYWDFPSYCFINFDSWRGFGALWDYASSKWWFGSFCTLTKLSEGHLGAINPKIFADKIYEYVKSLESNMR